MQIIYVVVFYHVPESTKNMKYAGNRNSFSYLCAKNYKHRTWIDRVIAKIKGYSFLPHKVFYVTQDTDEISKS